MEKETILEIEFKELWNNKFAWKIIKQDEKILKRRNFIDAKIRVNSLNSPFLTCIINWGILIFTGHWGTQRGFLQLRHLIASTIAISSVYPLLTSSKLCILTSASCNLSGTFFFLSSTISCFSSLSFAPLPLFPRQ